MEFLKKLWSAWRRFGHWMGDLVGRVVLTVLYFTVVLPFGIGVRLFSDPLKTKKIQAETFWHPRENHPVNLEEARRQ